MYLILEGLMFLALAGLLAAFHSGFFVWAVLFKGLTSLFFVLAGVCGYIKYKDRERRLFSGPVCIALLFSMAGDVLLAVDQNRGIFFVLGVVGFAAAHVMFSLSFCRMCAVEKKDMVCTAVLFAGLALVLMTGDFDFQGLLPVLLGYAAVISFMLVKALSLWRCRQRNIKVSVLVMLGGVLFLLSDVVLLYWLFGVGMPEGVQWANWILYYMAQGCLSASLSA
ncbi:MAG: lysoplasmalogenase [Lachnospiraceae bacterium]|nr:lysoplasmalogenase [Lachnospiraceae bacterium]